MRPDCCTLVEALFAEDETLENSTNEMLVITSLNRAGQGGTAPGHTERVRV